MHFSCYNVDGGVDNETCTAPYPPVGIVTAIPWGRCTFGNMNNCVAVFIDVDPASLYITEINGVMQPQQIMITNITVPA